MSSFLIILLLATGFVYPCLASRKLTSLYQPPPQVLTYHKGPLLEASIPISILWYGTFSPSQKSIINDFILSLTPQHQTINSIPTVSKWWKTVDQYLHKARKRMTQITLSTQITDSFHSLGKSLKRSQLTELATRFRPRNSGLVVILTADDVTVEGFCMNACGLHSSFSGAGTHTPYVWVGNSVSQCPGQCAWPFHEPLYGPRAPPLVAPNGDVGVDGMVINLGTLLAGAVTNPFGNGWFLGGGGARVEVVGACVGVFGKGAYPGYCGEVRVDLLSGGSYNVEGVRGRKYLLPAMLDSFTSTCSLMV